MLRFGSNLLQIVEVDCSERWGKPWIFLQRRMWNIPRVPEKQPAGVSRTGQQWEAPRDSSTCCSSQDKAWPPAGDQPRKKQGEIQGWIRKCISRRGECPVPDTGAAWLTLGQTEGQHCTGVCLSWTGTGWGMEDVSEGEHRAWLAADGAGAAL